MKQKLILLCLFLMCSFAMMGQNPNTTGTITRQRKPTQQQTTTQSGGTTKKKRKTTQPSQPRQTQPTQQQTTPATPKEDEMENRASPSKNSAILPTKKLIQRIIYILKDAKQLKRKKPEEIAQRLQKYHDEVVTHLDTLVTRFPDGTFRHKFMSNMSNALRKEDLWYHTKDPNKDGYYCTTPKCSERLKSYADQMQEFHNKLPNDEDAAN